VPGAAAPLAARVFGSVSIAAGLGLTQNWGVVISDVTRGGPADSIVLAIDGRPILADDRPEFQKLLDYCRENKSKIAHVVVADLSRFARNMEDQVTAMTRLARMGIALQSVDEPHIDRTAAGRLTANLLGAVNQFYSDSLSERVRYRMQEAVKAGRFVNRAPIGYRNVQNNGSKGIIVDGDRAPLIKKAFELVASGSYSSDAVLRTVTALGLRTPNGLVLPKQSFSKMLKNPIYADGFAFPAAT
jgi:DNA invertase Pin-like site-specific DNA recombinase